MEREGACRWNRSVSPPLQIKTYVFIDFETTGSFSDAQLNFWLRLPVPGARRNDESMFNFLIDHTDLSRSPHATEVALLAVPRELLQDAIARMGDEEDEVLPRAVNVHTRQMKPNLSENEWAKYRQAQATNCAIQLTQSELLLKASFAEEWPGVRHFLTTVPKPACLIAHNGLRFDFRLLNAEFDRNNMPMAERLPDGIFFVDSYLMARDLEKTYLNDLRLHINGTNWSMVRPVESVTNQPEPDQPDTTSDLRSVDADDLNALTAEDPGPSHTTPSRVVRSSSDSEVNAGNQRARRRLFDGTPADSPTRYLRQETWSPAKKLRFNRDYQPLLRRNREGNWSIDNLDALSFFRSPRFKLKTLYEDLVGGTFNAHRAEDDCRAMMGVCIAYGNDFIHYANSYACQFPPRMLANR